MIYTVSSGEKYWLSTYLFFIYKTPHSAPFKVSPSGFVSSLFASVAVWVLVLEEAETLKSQK